MLEWLTANWIWILVVLGAGWLILRRNGMGCGMGGHGHRHEPGARAREVEGGERGESSTTPAGAAGRSRRHRGCC